MRESGEHSNRVRDEGEQGTKNGRTECRKRKNRAREVGEQGIGEAAERVREVGNRVLEAGIFDLPVPLFPPHPQ